MHKKTKSLNDFYQEISRQNEQRVRRIYEKKMEELSRNGMVENSKGEIACLVKSEFGTLIYLLKPEEVKDFWFRTASAMIAKLSDLPITIEDLRKIVDLPDDDDNIEINEISVRLGDESLEQVKKISNDAFNYFKKNLRSMLADSIQRFVLESFGKSLLESSGQSFFLVEKTEVQFFNGLTKIINQSLRERMDVRKASGNKAKRSVEELSKMLDFYNERLSLIKNAHWIYNIVDKDKTLKFNDPKDRQIHAFNSVAGAYPQLSGETINCFKFSHMSDSDLAIEELKGRFNLDLEISSIRDLLVKARAELKTVEEVGCES